jgi:hypothetical protein
MPGLVRKLLVFAAVDGLILQPAPPRNHPPATQQAIKIDYKGNVGPLLKDRREADAAPVSLESHGIVGMDTILSYHPFCFFYHFRNPQTNPPCLGLLKIATSFFLISISAREQVAQIRGKPIYKITDITLIPLSSQSDADQAIVSAREHILRHSTEKRAGEDGYDSESEDEAASVTDSLVEEPANLPTEVKDSVTGQRGPVQRETSIAEDVMHKKGVYGRFADKWFSKKGWSADSKRVQGLSSDKELPAPKNVDSTIPEEEEHPKSSSDPDALPVADKDVAEPVSPEEIPKALTGEHNSTTATLLPKILRTTKLYFASGNFFFSYDYDLSHSVSDHKPNSTLALFKQYDPLVSINYIQMYT